jgi:hypothetical protein
MHREGAKDLDVLKHLTLMIELRVLYSPSTHTRHSGAEPKRLS